MKTFFAWCIALLLILAVITAGIGIHKLTQYDSGYRMVNAYVGGDAYNYIINSAMATAYFVASGGCAITAVLIAIVSAMQSLQKTINIQVRHVSKQSELLEEEIKTNLDTQQHIIKITKSLVMKNYEDHA